MLSYRTLTSQEYIDGVIDVISRVEDHIQNVKNIGDGKATIGYGYTFNRNDNVAIWQASSIALSASEWSVLQTIDEATISAQKTAIALNQFSRTLTREEAKILLAHTYKKYELSADQLSIPESRERIALVSLSYNGAIWGE